MALSLCPLLTQGAIDAILAHGSDEQKATYLPKMMTGEWTGTMNLTEPQAGSDVGAVATKAEPNADGSWSITGQKIFITYGEHDLADQILHLVLARTPGSPPGTKGISMFLVPKFVLDDDGSLARLDDVGIRDARGTPNARDDLFEFDLVVFEVPAALFHLVDVSFVLGDGRQRKTEPRHEKKARHQNRSHQSQHDHPFVSACRA